MIVKEMRKLVEGEQTFVLIDNVSGAQVFSEKEANDSSYPNVRESRWKRLENYNECEVIGLRTHSDSEVAFYIDAPIRKFETWLDVEYSVRIKLEVPYGEDENTVLAEYARKKVEALPKKIKFGDDEWVLGYDNMESGSFFDCIEER